MECSWAGLVRKVSAAEDLDQVISAHDNFLEQITAQCLLDEKSQVNDRLTDRQTDRHYVTWGGKGSGVRDRK